MLYKKNANIIVIDDNEDICEMINTVLSTEGFHVEIYSDSVKFSKDINNFSHDNTDIFIIDLMMPELDGFQILDLLNKNESTRYVPKMVVSAFQSSDNMKDSFEYGVLQFIQKPLDIQEFIYQVKTLLRIKLYEDNNRKFISMLQDNNRKLLNELMSKKSKINTDDFTVYNEKLTHIIHLINEISHISKTFKTIYDKESRGRNNTTDLTFNELTNKLNELSNEKGTIDSIHIMLKKIIDMVSN